MASPERLLLQLPLGHCRVVGLVDLMAVTLDNKRVDSIGLALTHSLTHLGLCMCTGLCLLILSEQGINMASMCLLTSSAGVDLCTERSLTVLCKTTATTIQRSHYHFHVLVVLHWCCNVTHHPVSFRSRLLGAAGPLPLTQLRASRLHEGHLGTDRRNHLHYNAKVISFKCFEFDIMCQNTYTYCTITCMVQVMINDYIYI